MKLQELNMSTDHEKKIDFLKKIIHAYEKVNRLSNLELLDAESTIKAHEKIARFSRQELLKAKKEINDLKNKESVLRQEIMEILSENFASEDLLIQKIENLSKKKEKGFYSDLFKVVASIDLPEDEAYSCWNDILKHSEEMSMDLKRPIGFRVAMLDYFINNKKLVKNPKIIEFDAFEEVIKNSIIDELTGIYNRRYFNTTLEKELKRSTRYSKKLCLFLFDIDYFKTYNDSFGHAEGDIALQFVSGLMNHSFRLEDTVCRTGGEEFSVILPETEIEAAYKACFRFSEILKHSSSLKLKRTITISGGISTFPDDSILAEELYVRADELAYISKKSGKDKISI